VEIHSQGCILKKGINMAHLNNNLALDKILKNFTYSYEEKELYNIKVKYFIGEYWTSKQRQTNSLHEISYRACFKPQLPNFFIQNFTKKDDIVYDPFLGRGTTLIESILLNRQGIGNDINPLSKILIEPRITPPTYNEVESKLNKILFYKNLNTDIDISMFYHPETLSEIVSLRNYILELEKESKLDNIDKWIRMVATNRLTGHSKGFFSVYTLPPNQAVSQQRQIEINKKRNQIPEYKNVKELILKKTKALLKDVDISHNYSKPYVILNQNATNTPQIKNNSIDLIVTSPPFLNVVQYSKDNWLRCWFNGIDIKKVENNIFITSSLEKWNNFMYNVLIELFRILKPQGVIAFEVGEVRNGKIKLEEQLIPLAKKIGFNIEGVIINQQSFTKTSNIWGIKNNTKGTNSNRIIILSK
jgi:DNA modification methylase